MRNYQRSLSDKGALGVVVWPDLKRVMHGNIFTSNFKRAEVESFESVDDLMDAGWRID
jgi:hypothetical protein